MLLLLFAACAVVGGVIALWRQPRLPGRWPLLVIAALPQLAGIFGLRSPLAFAITVAALSAWCLSNRAVAGVPLVAAGACMNLLVMALHGGAMPIHADTLARLGYQATAGATLAGSKDIVAASPLWLLSDWIVFAPQGFTLVASPGDLLLLIGLVQWLLFSRSVQRRQPTMISSAVPTLFDAPPPLLPGRSARPALTRLALLAAANPVVAERLLRDPLDAARAHPHYAVSLDEHDCATLTDIQSRASTVNEFLSDLATVVDG